jgi:tetratricopeptide (TPR) repeat protein
MMARSLSVAWLAVPALPALAGITVSAEETKACPTEQYPEISMLLNEKNFEAALLKATKAIQENPKSGQAFFLLGRTQFYRGQDAAALEAFGKAIERSPSLAEAWFFRGLTFVYMRQPNKAQSDLEQAIRLSPQESRYWFELGKLHERAGMNDAATTALEKAVSLDPNRAQAWFALGTLASEKGGHAKACEMWEKALLTDPKYADAHWNLGIHHQLRGDPKASLSHFLSVLELRPQDVEAAKKVLQAYYRLEDYENAKASRARLLDLIARSGDPKIRGMKEFCFDQFDASGGRFFAYETMEKKGGLFHWFTFKLADSEGNVIKSINLETDDYMKDQGWAFILGQTVGSTHCTFDAAFRQMPSYPELKKLVLKANNGELRVAASSSSQAQ